MNKNARPRNKVQEGELALSALDRIDRRILNHLQQDARMKNEELAQKVGLSPAPCSRRVKRLRQEGYILRDVSLVDTAKTGHALIAFVSVELDRQREDALAAFERHIAAQPEVQQCYFISGESDYLLLVSCRDMEHYNDFVRDVLAREHNIRRFRTSFTLRRVKYDTAVHIEE